MTLSCAADDIDAATSAARSAAQQLELAGEGIEVLHQSNNVVMRVGDAVLKIGADAEAIRRDVRLCRHAARNGGPVIAPLGEPLEVGDFVVSAWPYRSTDPVPPSDEAVGRALGDLHRALADALGPLPTLADRFAEVGGLLDDETATAARPTAGRRVLAQAIDSAAIDEPSEDVVLHAEPHDGNRLVYEGSVLYFDLEAACRGPLEWDLAYVSQGVADLFWPDHDRERRRRLRTAVSVCVSTYCWRHVTARPTDIAMRWHAEHHLSAVAGAPSSRVDC